MDPAPYGGFLTRTVEQENEQKRKLDSQRVPVDFQGNSDVLRPEGIHVQGVDKLATNDIKAYVDYYINYRKIGDTFEPLEDKMSFRVQWIDDSNVNLIFKTHNDALSAMKGLLQDPMQFELPVVTTADVNMEDISTSAKDVTENIVNDAVDVTAESPVDGAEKKETAYDPTFTPEYVACLLIEREAQTFASSLQFRKFLRLQEQKTTEDLFKSKKEEKEAVEEEKLVEEGSSVALKIRMALRSDQKVQNAAAYSRYYLLHGEPDRSRPSRQERNGDRRGRYQREERTQREETVEEKDLFLEKLISMEERRARSEIEEDLFADRMRERSPSRRRRRR